MEKEFGNLGFVIYVVMRSLRHLIEERKLWNKIFPLKKGIKVKLIQDTSFGDLQLKKGKIGRVFDYTEGSPIIYIDFGYEKRIFALQVKRIRKVLE